MTHPESARAEPLGYDLVGAGPTRVVVLNDWLCDTTTWDPARPYLDVSRFTFAFTDLRGYGRSRGRSGAFTLEEAAHDVLTTAETLGWGRFALVGHSMSALVALHLAQHHAERVERVVALTPPPPRGMGADDGVIDALRAVAHGDDEARGRLLARLWGERLSAGWTSYKAGRWRAQAEPAAVAAYVTLFARDGLPAPEAAISVPVLALTGEEDAPAMRSEGVRRALGPLCADLTVTPLGDCGHYPMQEMPPLTVALVERFLALSEVQP